jgi:hypothetical protein
MKHSGCWLCGSATDEFLVSITVGIADIEAPSIALCSDCRTLDQRELRIRARQLSARKQEALAAIRSQGAR